ncbi:MAG: 16S rRNA (guanine(527)-N(7))-methyltransferase RsmG [Candidatus Eremiobacteraeota bacterium]|nr:16S rRNA (guanine(527)-N(7))-methyltransferase RsmG [Candidatus Eremiobacteraeota bacterium]
MSEFDELLELLSGHVPEAHRERLSRYGARVLEVNRKFNLTGAKDAAEFAPHIIDSVSIAEYVEQSLIDIGSGGGLPGIPLAIVTGVPVTMVESTTKKARFLESLLAEFELQGAVVAQRAEVAAHDADLREHFHTGTARAVSSAPTVAELLLPFIQSGGRAVLQRGTMDEREYQALEDASLVLGGRVERVVPQLPEIGEAGIVRQVVIVEKTGHTQPRFPRRVGIPEKRPLCF